MNIVLFSDTYPPEINGVAVSVFNHANVLRQHGHQVYVVTTNPFTKQMTFEQDVLRIPGQKIKQLYGYVLASFYSKKAFQIIKKWSIDVIHVHTEYGIGIFGRTVAKKLHQPLVYTYHTMYEDYTYYLGFLKRIADLFVKSLSKRLATRCDAVIAPSEKTKQSMIRYGVKRPIEVIPTGIDFSKFKFQNLDPKKLLVLKKQYHLEEKKVILSLGRVAKEKSIDLIIRSFAELTPAIRSSYVLLIVGGGPALDSLKTLAKQLKIEHDVQFVGPVPSTEVQYYYHLADVFANASLTETQGLTYMEAMAANTLVLARFDDNIKDLIIPRKTGFLFKDEHSFAEELAYIANLSPIEKKKMIQAALQIVNDYDIETFYERLMTVYLRVKTQ